MSNLKKAAIMYDFDKTLCTTDMQEYVFIPGVGETPEKFWADCAELQKKYDMDGVLAYLYFIIRKARGNLLLTKKSLVEQGRHIKFFDGVTEWFDRINAYAAGIGLLAEHYVISSGLKSIIEGSAVADKFKKIFACEFCYDKDGVPFWPAVAVNFTEKTQYLFRISKGSMDIKDALTVNRAVPQEKLYVPFCDMIYIGDGITDVPSMKLTKNYGGYSLGVYTDASRENAKILIDEGRVNAIAPADYREGGEADLLIKARLRHIAGIKDCPHEIK